MKAWKSLKTARKKKGVLSSCRRHINGYTQQVTRSRGSAHACTSHVWRISTATMTWRRRHRCAFHGALVGPEIQIWRHSGARARAMWRRGGRGGGRAGSGAAEVADGCLPHVGPAHGLGVVVCRGLRHCAQEGERGLAAVPHRQALKVDDQECRLNMGVLSPAAAGEVREHRFLEGHLEVAVLVGCGVFPWWGRGSRAGGARCSKWKQRCHGWSPIALPSERCAFEGRDGMVMGGTGTTMDESSNALRPCETTETHVVPAVAVAGGLSSHHLGNLKVLGDRHDHRPAVASHTVVCPRVEPEYQLRVAAHKLGQASARKRWWRRQCHCHKRQCQC